MAKEYIISYDIRHPKRLQRIHKALLGFGIPLQYSVFYVKEGKNVSVDDVWTKLAELIKQDEDDVRLYPVSNVQLTDWNKLGASNVSAGVYIE